MNGEVLEKFNERSAELGREITKVRTSAGADNKSEPEAELWDRAAAALVLSDEVAMGGTRNSYVGLWRWLHTVEGMAISKAKGGEVPESVTLKLDTNGVFVLSEILAVGLNEIGKRAALARAMLANDPNKMAYWAPPKREPKAL